MLVKALHTVWYTYGCHKQTFQVFLVLTTCYRWSIIAANENSLSVMLGCVKLSKKELDQRVQFQGFYYTSMSRFLLVS